MFKRQNRLGSGVRFNNSSSFSAPQFILKIKKNGLTLNRFGIVVGKKIDKRAVIRNRIKRIFRAKLVELNKDMIAGYDMLFIARPAAIKHTKQEIDFAITSILKEKGYIKNTKA